MMRFVVQPYGSVFMIYDLELSCYYRNKGKQARYKRQGKAEIRCQQLNQQYGEYGGSLYMSTAAAIHPSTATSKVVTKLACERQAAIEAIADRIRSFGAFLEQLKAKDLGEAPLRWQLGALESVMEEAISKLLHERNTVTRLIARLPVEGADEADRV